MTAGPLRNSAVEDVMEMNRLNDRYEEPQGVRPGRCTDIRPRRRGRRRGRSEGASVYPVR